MAASLAVVGLLLAAQTAPAQLKQPTPPRGDDKVLPPPTLVEQDKRGAADRPRDGMPAERPGTGFEQYQIQLELPSSERVFLLESEKAWQQRIRKEAQARPKPEVVKFPPETVVSGQQYQVRMFPPATEWVEPNYVCYRRLYFEDKNSERYGWDLGFVQPLVSLAYFCWDAALLPYHMGTDPCRKYECSAGQCLPGDAVPYLLYPPQISLTGAFLEAATIVGLFGIFPG